MKPNLVPDDWGGISIQWDADGAWARLAGLGIGRVAGRSGRAA